MGMNRELRFLIPPVVALASVFWSLVIDPAFCATEYLGDLHKLAGGDLGWLLFLGGGAAVLAAGCLISAVSAFALNMYDRRLPRSYEADLSKETLRRLAEDVSVAAPQTKEQDILVANCYVHDVMAKDHPGLVAWCSNRWDHFVVSTHLVCALALSLLGGMVVQCCLHHSPLSWRLFWWWLLPGILLMIILWSNASRAYKQNWGMVEFCVRVRAKSDERG